ncbi:conserved hypothetical protein [Ricinus communis]|uniref:Uncharacterized protein n=1 Tax=Ricinus communis TaxID=3988 RepID=B9SVP7_RICCO|nr:conserved hypothetical protein [Ricinus communis]
MPKTGYDLENPVGLKNGKGIKKKGLDEGTKRGRSQLFDVRLGGTSQIIEQEMGQNLKLMSHLSFPSLMSEPITVR